MHSICLVSQNASSALGSKKTNHIGGVERQTALLANWLVSRGYSVSVITWADFPGQSDETEDGVRKIRLCMKTTGLPLIRFFWPRWISMSRALVRANADIYYYNAADAVTGQIARWCRSNSKRFVYSVASEPACDRSLPSVNGRLHKWLYKYGLLNADLVIVQTVTQQDKLATSFGVKSTIAAMPCEYRTQQKLVSPKASEPWSVLWVGRIVGLKRLEMLLDAALELHDVQFKVVGAANRRTDYADHVIRKASEIPNVDLVGRVGFELMHEFYESASMLVCTSKYEGFPNSFLEAMSFGLPIITTFDPGGVIARNHMGVVVSDVKEIVDSVRLLRERPERYKRMSEAAAAYYSSNHEASVALPRYEEILVNYNNTVAG